MTNEHNQSQLQAAPHIIRTVSIDCVIFSLEKGQLKVLLVQHGDGIREGQWGLPGGWILENESLDEAASRLLKDLTSIDNLYLEQLRAFGRVDRFPGDRVITVAYTALVSECLAIFAGAQASDVRWYNIDDVPALVFDHDEILDYALKSLRHKVRHEPIGFNLLPQKFTLLQLQELYETVLSVKLDKPNFRRKMMNMKLLVPCNEKQVSVAHRAAALYRFDETVYHALQEQDFAFEI